MRIPALSLAVLVLAGCSSGSSVKTYAVPGVLQENGGPAGTAPMPVAGSIKAVGTGKTFTATADGKGAFTLRLPAGDYTITGTSPSFNGGSGTCFANGSIRAPLPVAGLTIEVDCPIK